MRVSSALCIAGLCGCMYLYAAMLLVRALRAVRIDGGRYSGRTRTLVFGPNHATVPAPWLGPEDVPRVVVWVSPGDPLLVLGTGEGRPIPPMMVMCVVTATLLLAGYGFGWVRHAFRRHLIKKTSAA